MSYRIIDLDTYYRKKTYLRFAKGPKCSISMTYDVDITRIREICSSRGEKINIAILYLISETINSRDDYKMYYDFQKDEVRCYDFSNPCHYLFNEKTETCISLVSKFYPDYKKFYSETYKDIEEAKKPGYQPDDTEYPDSFNASCMPWVSYKSFELELPDGYLYFNPNVNWGKFYVKDGKTMLPLTVRMNHAIADGYLLSKFFLLLEDFIKDFK